MHDRRRHLQRIGRKAVEVMIMADCDFDGRAHCYGDVVLVPVHMADALIRAGLALISDSPQAGLAASPPAPKGHPAGDLPTAPRRRRSRRSDGDGG
jgi:hypothetical protein